MRLHLDYYTSDVNDDDDTDWVKSCRAPSSLALAVKYIVSSFTGDGRKKDSSGKLPETLAFKESYDNYCHFFKPGTCHFQFPVDWCVDLQNPCPPSPAYDSIQGQSFIYLDWHLIHPEFALPCPHCARNGKNGHLVHDRSNFGKSKTLFPIWNENGIPTWSVIMVYKCDTCPGRVKANDGQLLHLPPYLASMYPVLPRYATGDFHLNHGVSNLLEHAMLTYGNPGWVSRSMFQNMGDFYVKTLEFLSKKEFFGIESPPSDESLGSLYEEAEECILNPYGYSHRRRYERELQNVNVHSGESIAFDHTFQVTKNYHNLHNGKAVFTGMKGTTKEVVVIQTVNSTSAHQTAHCLKTAIEKRVSFKPACVYTDTCPNNTPFYQSLFGKECCMRLGLFHLMQRIVKTLDNRCDLYREALTDLKKCFYHYHPEDEANLIQALKNGSFSKNGKKHTAREIERLKMSKKWNQRYSTYLRKIIHPGATINHKLSLWIDTWEDKKDFVGKSVFTRDTLKTTREQANKVSFANDVENMYNRIPPGPKSTHGLPKWQSTRPESSLEKYHEKLANFGNGGTNKKRTHLLILRGTCAWNCKMRWRYEINRRKIECEKKQQSAILNLPPVQWEDTPPYLDHSYLDYLNQKAIKLGFKPSFGFVTTINEHNGEKFLSDYLEDQEKRNSEFGIDKVDKLCRCNDCSNSNIKTTQQQQHESNVIVDHANQDQEPQPQQQEQQEKPIQTIQKPTTNNNTYYNNLQQCIPMNEMISVPQQQ